MKLKWMIPAAVLMLNSQVSLANDDMEGAIDEMSVDEEGVPTESIEGREYAGSPTTAPAAVKGAATTTTNAAKGAATTTTNAAKGAATTATGAATTATTAATGAATATMDSAKVMELQKALNKNGAKLKVDGQWNKTVETAVKDYQKKNGLQVTGQVDASTMTKLGLAQ